MALAYLIVQAGLRGNGRRSSYRQYGNAPKNAGWDGQAQAERIRWSVQEIRHVATRLTVRCLHPAYLCRMANLAKSSSGRLETCLCSNTTVALFAKLLAPPAIRHLCYPDRADRVRCRLPLRTGTSTWRSLATLSYGLWICFGIWPYLRWLIAVLQGGLLHRRTIPQLGNRLAISL